MKRLVGLLTLLILLIIACSNEETGKVLIISGNGEPGFIDGENAELNKPIRLAAYTENSIVFADINNHAIRIATFDGKVTTIAGGPDKKGYQDGPAVDAKFNSPHGVTYDITEDKIYVAEAGNHTIRIITKTENGTFEVSTIAGIPGAPGFNDGAADSAMFISPHAVILCPEGGVYVADIGNAKVRLIRNGKVSTVAENKTSDKENDKRNETTFKYVMDIVIDGESILLADAGLHLIHRIIPNESVTTIQLNDTLSSPHGIAVDDKKNIYIADMGTHRILKIDPSGNITPLVGTGKMGSKINELKKPAAVLVHGDYLWIADLENHQIKAIKISY
jgi:DNA-binding beta-propeller fold protein YncE